MEGVYLCPTFSPNAHLSPHVLRSRPKQARKSSWAERASVWAGKRNPPFTAFSPHLYGFITEEHGHKTIFRVFPPCGHGPRLCASEFTVPPPHVPSPTVDFLPSLPVALPSKPTTRRLPLNPPPQPL